MKIAYYNEFDKNAASWLRELIAEGLIAFGDVDERSIEDVSLADLVGYSQCHFFAGIGGWPLALRMAGWPDDRPVWTGSCPCQPFSAAGKGGGFADERHLWPHFHWLISQCRPAKVFGEQVASRDGLEWFDLVHADLEGSGYSVGAADLCAAGFGAPHIRQRLYWVADANGSTGREGGSELRGWSDGGHAQPRPGLGGSGVLGRLAHSSSTGLEGRNPGALGHEREAAQRDGAAGGMGNPERLSAGRDTGAGAGQEGGAELRAVGDDAGSPGAACGMGNADGGEQGALGRVPKGAGTELSGGQFALRPGPTNGFWRDADWLADTEQLADRREAESSDHVRPQADRPSNQHGGHRGSFGGPGPTNGFWRDADWLGCRDGRWRPVEPGTFPLVARVSSGVVRGGDSGVQINPKASAEGRVMRLRGYGNSIVPQVAAAFIRACY